MLKTCPNCGANVEGLIHHCDCCSELLYPEKRFLTWLIWEFPCGFTHVFEQGLIPKLKKFKGDQYSSFLDHIFFDLYCYPKFVIEGQKIRSGVRYYALKKDATVKVVIEATEFANSDVDKKSELIAKSMYEGLQILNSRLHKHKHEINDLIAFFETEFPSIKMILDKEFSHGKT